MAFLKHLCVAANLQITNKNNTILPPIFSLKFLIYLEIISPKAKFHAGRAFFSFHFACINPISYELSSNSLYARDWHQSHFLQAGAKLKGAFGLWELSICFGGWSENIFSVTTLPELLGDNARKVQFSFQPNPDAS